MLVTDRRRKLLFELENVYFAQDWRQYRTTCDAVLFYSSQALPAGLNHGAVSQTILIDLSAEEESLLHDMRKSTRQDIRRALENPALSQVCLSSPEVAQLQDFCRQYDRFAEKKGIRRIDGPHLFRLLQEDCLALLYVKGPDGGVLCGEVDIVLPERCYGAYAFTTFREQEDRQLAGQANKLLYWLSIRNGKEKGCKVYDMAGLANGGKGAALDGIDAFKRGFGGKVVDENNFYHGYTLKGKLLVLLFKVLHKSLDGWD